MEPGRRRRLWPESCRWRIQQSPSEVLPQAQLRSVSCLSPLLIRFSQDQSMPAIDETINPGTKPSGEVLRVGVGRVTIVTAKARPKPARPRGQPTRVLSRPRLYGTANVTNTASGIRLG